MGDGSRVGFLKSRSQRRGQGDGAAMDWSRGSPLAQRSCRAQDAHVHARLVHRSNKLATDRQPSVQKEKSQMTGKTYTTRILFRRMSCATLLLAMLTAVMLVISQPSVRATEQVPFKGFAAGAITGMEP